MTPATLPISAAAATSDGAIMTVAALAVLGSSGSQLFVGACQSLLFETTGKSPHLAQRVSIELTPNPSGCHGFACQMGMNRGTPVVR
jgi:hypothetical protein